MKTRTKRLLEIRKILGSSKVNSQEELMVRLEKKGYSYTQATLSRDLKFLKVGRKANEEGGFNYFLPEDGGSILSPSYKPDALSTGFRSIEFARNLAVIKTTPGFASGIAYAIDGLNAYEILGTIAGDDTILLISRYGARKSDILAKLTLVIPDVEERA
jgi:transcriptional regulator of arginine metabolism